jgi:hypothetical protein
MWLLLATLLLFIATTVLVYGVVAPLEAANRRSLEMLPAMGLGAQPAGIGRRRAGPASTYVGRRGLRTPAAAKACSAARIAGGRRLTVEAISARSA